MVFITSIRTCNFCDLFIFHINVINNSFETRAAVDRIANAAEDLIPSVGPLGEGFKGNSPQRRVNFPSSKMSEQMGDFDEKPVTPSENKGAGSSADFELTEQPKVYQYKLPRMMKVGQDRLAVGYTSDEMGHKIRTISVRARANHETRRVENEDD